MQVALYFEVRLIIGNAIKNLFCRAKQQPSLAFAHVC